MGLLGSLKAGALLPEKTHLSPVIRNETRWSSTFKMIQRYLAILPHIKDIVPSSVQLAPIENEMLGNLCEKLSAIEILTKGLQSEDLQLCHVRECFDAAIRDFGQLEQHCSDSSDIQCDPNFESAIVKIQKLQLENKDLDLTRAEKAAVKHLLKPRAEEVEEKEQSGACNISEAIRLINKRKTTSFRAQDSDYIDCRFIRPTTNVCERLFSVSGYALTKNRQGLLPENLEMQLFLKANIHLWDESLFMATME